MWGLRQTIALRSLWVMRIMGYHLVAAPDDKAQMERHVGAAPDHSAQIYVDYAEYGIPFGAAPDNRVQIYVDYVDYAAPCGVCARP